MLCSRTNVPMELAFRAEGDYEDLFSEVEVDAIFTGPEGETWRVPAFWAGGDSFGVRFAAPSPGRYRYESVCTNTGNAGLHGQTGEIEVLPYGGHCDLYRHGRLRVAETRRTLEHLDGTPFFWLGDTWWMGLTKRWTWPDDFRVVTADRVAKAFNVVQIVAGPLPGIDITVEPGSPHHANEGGPPWEQGWARLNPRYYDMADRRILHLVENGIVPCILAMWGYYLPYMGVDKVKQHWRNLVARYGAYSVVWCVAGEVNMPVYSAKDRGADEAEAARIAQEEDWTEVARYLRDLDPYHNPITAHPSRPDSREMLRDESVLDVDMLQTGHGGYSSMKPTVDMVNTCLEKRPRMPVVNSEVCYEGIMGGSWQDVQRFMFWTSITSGSAGHTYGAHGLWAASPPGEPLYGVSTHWRRWGERSWQDAMRLPGSTQMGIGRRFFERYPWWIFQPRHEPEAEEAGRVSAFATGIPGALAIFYLAGSVEAPYTGVAGTRVCIEPGAKYQAFYFNPRTGKEVRVYEGRCHVQIEIGAVEPNEDGRWPVPPKPTMEDWVLVLEDTQALAEVNT